MKTETEKKKPDKRREYEARHRKIGLCIKCSDKAVYGTDYCAKHLHARRQLNKRASARQRERRKANNRCTRCGGPKQREGLAYCNNCIEFADRIKGWS